MKHYTKSDIDTHSAHMGNPPYYPAVNVKVHGLYPMQSKIEQAFNCSEETAEKALQFAFDSACEMFWNENAQEIANDVFGDSVTIYSAGRSSGWLIVVGLSDIEDWNAVDLAKWRKFENAIKAEVKYLTSWEYLQDMIDANRWAEDGAERYSFYEQSDGESFCFVDWKKEQIEKLGKSTINLISRLTW